MRTSPGRGPRTGGSPRGSERRGPHPHRLLHAGLHRDEGGRLRHAPGPATPGRRHLPARPGDPPGAVPARSSSQPGPAGGRPCGQPRAGAGLRRRPRDRRDRQWRLVGAGRGRASATAGAAVAMAGLGRGAGGHPGGPTLRSSGPGCGTLAPMDPLITTATSRDEQEHAARVAVLPVGSFEQHGDFLPLITDTVVAGLIARRVSTEYGLFLLPPVTLSCSHEHSGFPGTVSVSASTLTAVVADVAESLRAAGIDRLAIINGHGGNYVLANV